MARIRVDPLNIKVPIINPKTGTPTPTFMRIWQNLFGNDDDNADTIQDVVKDLRDNVIEAADSTIVVTGSGSLLDGPVKLAADVQAILNKLGSTQGAVLYRGATTWSALAPGTSGYVLTTGGAGANPAWAAGGGGTPSLTHSHIFVGNSSGVATDVAMSGDATIADTGAVTVTKTNGVAFGYFATGTDAANLTGTLNNARLSAVPNSALANSAITLNTHSVSLGGSLSLGFSDLTGSATLAQLPSIADDTILSNNSGSSAAPSAQSIDTILTTRGAVTIAKASAGYIFSITGDATVGFQNFVYSAGNSSINVMGGGGGTQASKAAPASGKSLGITRYRGWHTDGTPALITGAEWRCVTKETSWSSSAAGTITTFLNCAAGATTLVQHTQLEAEHQQFLGPVLVGAVVSGAPAAGFVLDLTSTTGALGVPSMTTTQKSALNGSSPVNRSIVYDSTLGAFQFRQAGSWLSLSGNSWTITDGTHSVAGVTTLTIAGSGVVGGTSPNATLTISGTGYAPGTVPTVVQVAHATSAISATFGVAPTNGNWMVAMAFNSNSNTVGTGWTKVLEQATGTDWGDILIKKAGASEPTSQSPMLNATANGCVVIWELSGANSTSPFGFGLSQAEQNDTQNVPITFANSVNCIGLSAVSVVTSGAVSAAFNVGTQDVLDNTGNRRLVAGHTDLSKTPQVGILAALSAFSATKGATCLITS